MQMKNNMSFGAVRNVFRAGVFGVLLACCSAFSFAYEMQKIAEGLEHPWCLAFLPDGSMLVTERSGQLRMIKDGRLLPDAVTGTPPVYVRSQGGLFDVILHPQFADNQLLYLSYAHGTSKANATRIVRARLEEGALLDLEIIFTARPDKNTPVHYGGRMIITPDNKLLMATGDGFDFREEAQKLDNHLGKTIRLNLDGSVPDDNPFLDRPDVLPEIYTYGHRNPQGLVVAGNSGRIYLHEHGPRGGDELNFLQPGLNYGWPIATFGIDYSGARISPFTEYPGTTQPLLHWTPSVAPAGVAWYGGEQFPEWQGNLFVATLMDKDVQRVDLQDTENPSAKVVQTLFSELGERIRDIRAAPDGSLYILTDSPDGAVIRVSATGK